jgi:hypothetical protein
MERLVHAPDTKTPLEDGALVSDLRGPLATATECPRHEPAISLHQQSAKPANVFRGQPILRCRLSGRVTCNYCAHFYRTVVAAFDVGMFVIAGHQKRCIHLAVRP